MSFMKQQKHNFKITFSFTHILLNPFILMFSVTELGIFKKENWAFIDLWSD